MIVSAASIRAPREFIPVDDEGWLGQVPPPAPPSTERATPTPDPVTGHESPRDAREAGWLGQVPPPAPPSTERATPAPDAVTGHESPRDAREAGWLGQVPPPGPPASSPDPAPPRETYANPQLAPEPWKSDPVLPGTDPTLFG